MKVLMSKAADYRPMAADLAHVTVKHTDASPFKTNTANIFPAYLDVRLRVHRTWGCLLTDMMINEGALPCAPHYTGLMRNTKGSGSSSTQPDGDSRRKVLPAPGWAPQDDVEAPGALSPSPSGGAGDAPARHRHAWPPLLRSNAGGSAELRPALPGSPVPRRHCAWHRPPGLPLPGRLH